jgi:putative two-component system response regulator
MLDRLTRVAAYCNDATGQHPWRVGQWAGRLALAVGFTPIDASLVSGAARYHDIGNIAIPLALFAKPGPLTLFEQRMLQSHTTVGAQLLEGARSPLLQLAATIAMTHHERWDGTGYPRRISGPAIPLGSRLVAVADAWDALTHERPHRAALTPRDALETICAHAGSQFDPAAVDALTHVLAEPAPLSLAPAELDPETRFSHTCDDGIAVAPLPSQDCDASVQRSSSHSRDAAPDTVRRDRAASGRYSGRGR